MGETWKDISGGGRLMGEIYIVVGVVVGLVGEYTDKPLNVLMGIILLVGGGIIRRLDSK